MKIKYGFKIFALSIIFSVLAIVCLDLLKTLMVNSDIKLAVPVSWIFLGTAVSTVLLGNYIVDFMNNYNENLPEDASKKENKELAGTPDKLQGDL